MKFLIPINKSTIRKNPNAGQTKYLIPGMVRWLIDDQEFFYKNNEELMQIIAEAMKSGKKVCRTQDIQTVHSISPEPNYLYEYESKEVQCEECGENFDYKELKTDSVYECFCEVICPKCGCWNCCELEYEKFNENLLVSL